MLLRTALPEPPVLDISLATTCQERRGLVNVAPDPGDRRSRLMALTPKGMALLAQAVPIWERAHQEIEGLLPDGEPEPPSA